MVDYGNMAMLIILAASALTVYFIRDLLHAVIVYGVFSLIMAVIWLQMNSPDLAITEAAAGVATTVLMMLVIFRTSRREE
ncbi:MAG: DUF4040 domain-containing protein [Firmicutes bacterium]|nr:DUF4040 domain-containing protein [Bacillota bacterium]